MDASYDRDLSRRIARQRAFHESDAPGDLLVYVNRGRYLNLNPFLCQRLFAGPVEAVLDEHAVPGLIEDYAGLLRKDLVMLHELEDDTVPAAFVYWGIGGITAAMTGLDPVHAENTCWLKANFRWEQIEELRFDPDNRWVQFALNINRELWRHWDEGFLILPFLHRSPLDAAYGIRGTEIFAEMYTAPGCVKELLEWCVDWQLSIENFLREQVPPQMGWGTGVWETWLPDGGVFVNGDPVGLISRPMMREFEQPYTARLFASTGGGFFHNHTVGLYQVDQVAETGGLLVQEFIPDPKIANLPEVMLTDSDQRDTILRSSLVSPIMIEHIKTHELNALLPIVREGRFILCLDCEEGDDPAEALRKVRTVSNLD